MSQQPAPDCDRRTEAARWLARRRNGERKPDDHHDFMLWLNADSANRAAYDQAEALWRDLGGLESVAGSQLAQARAHLSRSRRGAHWGRAALAAAACAVVLLFWHFDPLSTLNGQTFRTAHGERRSITLADGSGLELNTDSKAVVHYSRRARQVQLLQGQAVFTVQHSDERPFDVVVGNARIHDVGTQFDVRRFSDRATVSVLQGAVEVSVTGVDAAVPLHQGQQISYADSGTATALAQIDVEAYSAWRRGKLVFSNQPLREVLQEIERYHSATLTAAKPEILDIRVSGVFPADDLALTLKTIAATLPVRIRQTGPQSWLIAGR